MKKNIIIHIGIGKTGTSSIQKMLYNNREILKKNSVYFPTKGLYKHAHHHIALYDEVDIPNRTKMLINDIINDFMQEDCNTMVLSSEQFSYCKNKYISSLREIFNNFNVKIVFYVREQVKFVESSFLQKVKEGGEYFDNIEKFYRINKDGFDYMKRIEAWEKNFKKENILVKLYDKEFTPDVCENFIKLFSWNFLINKQQFKINENKSLHFDFMPIIKVLDEENINKITREKILNAILDLSEKYKSFLLKETNTKLHKQIKKDYYSSNLSFASKYLSAQEKEKFLS